MVVSHLARYPDTAILPAHAQRPGSGCGWVRQQYRSGRDRAGFGPSRNGIYWVPIVGVTGVMMEMFGS